MLGFHMLGKMPQFTSQWDPRVYPGVEGARQRKTHLYLLSVSNKIWMVCVDVSKFHFNKCLNLGKREKMRHENNTEYFSRSLLLWLLLSSS